MISLEDFEKIDIRVGTILEVRDFPNAKKPSYQLKIDFGKEGIRNSSAQVTTLYTIKSLVGKQVIAVINFPVRQIANFSVNALYWEYTTIITKLFYYSPRSMLAMEIRSVSWNCNH